MYKLYGQIAALFGALAVILGAYGAHGLKPLLDDYSRAIYEKGVSYHFYHTFALMAVAILMAKTTNSWLMWSGNCFALGILLFSGSLYLLATRSLLHIESFTPILGPITPIGGLFFIAGWVLLFIYFMKING